MQAATVAYPVAASASGAMLSSSSLPPSVDVDTHRAFARYKQRSKHTSNGGGAEGAKGDDDATMHDATAAAASSTAAAAAAASASHPAAADGSSDSDDDDDPHRLLLDSHIHLLLSRHIRTAEDVLAILPEKWPDSQAFPRKLLMQLQEAISEDSCGRARSMLGEFETMFGGASSPSPSVPASAAALSSLSLLPSLTPLRTGHVPLDALLHGGGLWRGEVTEIVGATCTGKTQVTKGAGEGGQGNHTGELSADARWRTGNSNRLISQWLLLLRPVSAPAMCPRRRELCRLSAFCVLHRHQLHIRYQQSERHDQSARTRTGMEAQ